MVDETVVLGALAATIVLGFLGQVFFRLTRISDIIILMAFGAAMGAVLPGFDPEPFRILAPVIGAFALLIILFEGGLDLNIRELVAGLGRASALAASGFVFTVLSVTIVGISWLGLDPMRGLLLGMILGGSSSIAVMPVVKRLAVHPKSRVVLSVESALTDVFCVVGALTLTQILALGQSPQVESVGREVLSGFAIAIGIGVVLGPVWLKILDMLGGKGNAYMLTVALILLLFLGTESVGGNGAIAVLVFGVVLGNVRSFRRLIGLKGTGFGHALRQFQSEVAFVVRAFFFVYLGLVFDLGLVDGRLLLDGLFIIVALAAARLLAVLVSSLGAGPIRKDRGVWWIMMPRGLAAAVLAGVPIARGVEGTGDFVAYASVVIVGTNILSSFAGLLVRGPEKPVKVPPGPQGELEALISEEVNPSPSPKPPPPDSRGGPTS
jgi:potassium/hydrogen antiporter